MNEGPRVTVTHGNFYIAVVLLVVYFYGEPDLHDAILHALMK